jgi:hypothetical protein
MTIFLTNEALAERLMALERMIKDRFEVADAAIALASRSMEKRLDGMNEFRESLRDQAARMVPKSEFDIVAGKIQEDIKILMKSRAELEGKASQQALLLVLAVAMSGMLFGIIGLIMRFLKV